VNTVSGLGRETGYRWLALLALGGVVGAIVAIDDPTSGRWGPVAVAFLPAVLAHLALTLPRATPFVRKNPAAIGLGYAVCAVPAVVGAAGVGPEAARTLVAVAAGLAVLAAGALCVRLLRVRPPDSSRAEQLSARVVLAGVAIAALAMMLDAGSVAARAAIALLPVTVLVSEAWLAMRTSKPARASVNGNEGITLEEVVRGLAHAMRKPLGMLASQLRALDGELTDATRRRELAHGVDLLEQLERMVGDLLRLAGSPADRRTLPMEKLVRLAASDVGTRFPEARIDLQLEPGLVVAADEVALRCIVVNLLENSLEAGGPSLWVSVVCRRSGLWVLLEVEDRSGGIPTEVRPRLFQPFVTTKERGTGLGLPTVREISRAHGGDAEVTHLEGGTRVTVRLPASAETL
jgi:signal transduction histidine kinase